MKRSIATLVCVMIGLVAASATAQKMDGKKGKTIKLRKTVPITAKVKVEGKKGTKTYTKKGLFVATYNDSGVTGGCSPDGSTSTSTVDVKGVCTVLGKKRECTCPVTNTYTCVEGWRELTDQDIGLCKVGKVITTDDVVAPETQTW